jgi:hypothetical protein
LISFRIPERFDVCRVVPFIYPGNATTKYTLYVPKRQTGNRTDFNVTIADRIPGSLLSQRNRSVHTI